MSGSDGVSGLESTFAKIKNFYCRSSTKYIYKYVYN